VENTEAAATTLLWASARESSAWPPRTRAWAILPGRRGGAHVRALRGRRGLYSGRRLAQGLVGSGACAGRG
jgi:hypothetical protein